MPAGFGGYKIAYSQKLARITIRKVSRDSVYS